MQTYEYTYRYTYKYTTYILLLLSCSASAVFDRFHHTFTTFTWKYTDLPHLGVFRVFI